MTPEKKLLRIIRDMIRIEDEDQVLKNCYGIDIHNPCEAELDQAIAEYAHHLANRVPRQPGELDITQFRHVGWCSVENCGLPQYRSPSGAVCENGHGGVPTLPCDPRSHA